LAIVFAVVLAPHGALAVMDLGAQTRSVHLVEPMVAAPWRSTVQPPSTWRPAFEHASDTLDVGLIDDQSQPLGLHVSYYRQQNYQRKLVSSESVLVKSQDPVWARVDGSSVNARLQGQPLRVESAVLRQHVPGTGADAQRLLAWRFYWVHGAFTASDYAGKIQGALGRISGWGDDGANIVIYTPLSDATDAEIAASARLQSYLDTQGDALVAVLEQTRGHD
jgi:EpsI family protein